MQEFARILGLTAPLFLLVLLGYAMTRWGRWPKPVAEALTRFVFSIAIPALLFHLMSDFSRLPPVDARLLIAYFGACMVVFLLARFIAARFFRLDGVAQSVFALGGIFANNVMLGIPLAKVTLGEQSLPVISLVLVFNALVLWTLVTVSVEWARHRALSWSGYVQAAKAVLANPVVASILLGTGWGLAALPLPAFVDRTLALVGEAAVPLSLIAMGMGLAEYGIREGWRVSAAITARWSASNMPESSRCVAARPRAVAAAAGNESHRAAGGAAGRRERVPDVAPVRHAGRPGRGESGPLHCARCGDDAIPPCLDRVRAELGNLSRHRCACGLCARVAGRAHRVARRESLRGPSR